MNEPFFHRGAKIVIVWDCCWLLAICFWSCRRPKSQRWLQKVGQKRRKVAQWYGWKKKKAPRNMSAAPFGCKGRTRTSTRRLATTQRIVVNPGRMVRLYAAFIPLFPTPETRGHGCLISSPHNFKKQSFLFLFDNAKIRECGLLMQIF